MEDEFGVRENVECTAHSIIAYGFFWLKTDGTGPLGRSKCRWEYNNNGLIGRVI